MTTNSTNKVVPLHSKKSSMRASERKWGRKVIASGFSVVPSLIFRAQKRLGLNATQLAVLLHLADFWWDKDKRPFPSKQTLADRLQLSKRQVQRVVTELERAGLIQRVAQHTPGGGRRSNIYDLSGLVNRLKELEPEFRDADKEARRVRSAVTKRRAGKTLNESSKK